MCIFLYFSIAPCKAVFDWGASFCHVSLIEYIYLFVYFSMAPCKAAFDLRATVGKKDRIEQ